MYKAPTVTLIIFILTLMLNINTAAAGLPLNIPIGTNIMSRGSSTADFLNSHLRSRDVVYARFKNLAELLKIKTAQKELIINDADIDRAEQIILTARKYGVTRIALNPERKYPIEKLIRIIKRIRHMSLENHMTLDLGLTLSGLIATCDKTCMLADAIVIQAQRLQGRRNFRENIATLIRRIKSVNPEAKIWVQISTFPPGLKNINEDTVIKTISSISNMVDGIFIYHPPSIPSSWETAAKTIKTLRSRN